MNRNDEQRFVPTDLRSQILYFLWSIGFDQRGEREALAYVILGVLKQKREREAKCAPESSAT